MIRKFEFVLIIIGLVLTAGSGSAQNYDVMPINPQFDLEKIKAEPEANGDPKRAASIRSQRISKENQNASQVFRTGDINNRFKGYYTQVIVPELTLYDKQSLAELTEKHHKIIKDFGTRIRNTDVHGYLVTEVFFPMLSQIVDGNYHPAVRYNAMLTIGKLDEVIGKQRIAAPKPYRKVLPFLIEKYNGFSDPKLAYLKYGAFKGIARVAAIEFQKQASTAGAAKPVLAALLGAKPADLDDDLFRSMQKTAVQVLGISGDPTNMDAFVNLLNDENASTWTRLEAAIAISKTKTNTVDAAKLESISNSVAKFMHDVLLEEVKSMDANQKRIATLAARKAELVAGPAKAFGGGKSSSDKMQGAEDRSKGLGAGGGSGAGAPPGGGGSGGGMMPGSGGGGSGRKRGGKKGANQLEDLPEYRIELARRRIKTVALGLVSAFGDANSPTGLLRWAAGNPKVNKLKEHMEEADKAAEFGLASDAPLVNNMTDALSFEFTKVARNIATTLGVAPAKGATTAKAKSEEKKKAGDAFINN